MCQPEREPTLRLQGLQTVQLFNRLLNAFSADERDQLSNCLLEEHEGTSSPSLVPLCSSCEARSPCIDTYKPRIKGDA
jgi:hypothetical protein